MHIAVDISLYPLAQAYIPPIQDFIARLEAAPGLRIDRNALSTQVSGDLAAVFATLEAEIARTFAAAERAVFVLKIIGGGAAAAA